MNSSKIFITDCEGPITVNDNAFELATHFIPEGGRFFKILSRYDDVLSYIEKRNNYKAGDTLKLLVPFLKAYGATNQQLKTYSSKNITFVPDADQTLRFILSFMPSFIISTSYEPYIHALCDVIGFPKSNSYSTRLNIDKYIIDEKEVNKLKALKEEISRMPMIEIPNNCKTVFDLPKEILNILNRLDEIFWKEIIDLNSGQILVEINPIGGYEKANAVIEIVKMLETSLSEVMYIGDSITDADPLNLVKNNGGLSVAFNGNKYAIRESEIAILSYNTRITSILAKIFNDSGKSQVLKLIKEGFTSLTKENKKALQIQDFKAENNMENKPILFRLTDDNIKNIIMKSEVFRKIVRGKLKGELG